MLNWLLISVMVFLPLRFAMAIDQSDCQMHDQDQVAAHHAHHHGLIESDQDSAVVSDNCCCCEDGRTCNYDCGVSISASVIIPPVVTVPLLNASSFAAQVESSLVSTELIPPTRPPAYL